MAIGIRKKVILISVATLFLTLVATTIVSSIFFMREYSSALISRTFMVGSILKYQLERLLKYDIPLDHLIGFDEQCQEILNNYGDITYAMVVDLKGKILFHNNPQKRGETVIYKNILEILENKKEDLQQHRENGEKFYNFIIPVLGLHREPLAAVIIGFPTSLISHKTAQMVAYSAGVAIIFLTLGGVSLILLLRLWVTTPLGQLLKAIMEIRSAGTDRAHLVTIRSKDEFGELGRAFNEMVLQLKKSHAQIENYTQELELKVQQSTSHLKEANEQLRQDIQARMKAEAALKKSEEKYRSLLNHAGDGILLADTHGNLLEANKKMEEMLGYPLEELLRLDFVHLHPAEERVKAREALARVVNQGSASVTGDWLVRRDGRKIPVDMTANLIEYDSERVIQGIYRDVSERRKAEEERLKISKLESLGTLGGGIAHDFNNILTAILGNINLAMLDSQGEEKVQERLANAEQACLKAQSLAKQLLTFAKGGTPIKKTIPLAGLLRESASLALAGSKARCEFSLPEDLWAVEVDAGQTDQAISNLLINADQAMPKGGIIKVRAENVLLGEESGLPLPPGKFVRISFADQGGGIDPEYLDKIFDPYFTTKKKGSGLGLATAYSIIKSHSGHLTMESEVGVGTTFLIYLPATDLKSPAQEEAAEETGRPGLGRGRILVMDDEELVLKVLGQILTYWGHEVEFARDGRQAVDKYAKAIESGRAYDGVILDLTVPGGMGGRETLQQLQAMDPRVKAIVSSGYSDDPIMANFKRYGFSGGVAKPYKASELIKILDEVIRKTDQ
jgi:PAS domain S-box-containing protein